MARMAAPAGPGPGPCCILNPGPPLPGFTAELRGLLNPTDKTLVASEAPKLLSTKVVSPEDRFDRRRGLKQFTTAKQYVSVTYMITFCGKSNDKSTNVSREGSRGRQPTP